MPKMRIPPMPVRHSRFLIVLEAVLATAAVHAILCFLCVYQLPETVSAPVRESGVSLLAPETFPEQRQLGVWLELHDPALAVRSDNRHGYASLLDGFRPRNYQNIPPPLPVEHTAGAELPDFLPVAIRRAAAVTRSRELFPAVRISQRTGRRSAIAFDENNRQLDLNWNPPAGEFAARPSVIRLRSGGTGMLRRTLWESCGNPVLDQAAMQTLAGAELPETALVTVYWPEEELREDEL